MIPVPREVFDRVQDHEVVHLELRAGNARPVRAYFVFDGPERGLRLVGLEHRDHPWRGVAQASAEDKPQSARR